MRSLHVFMAEQNLSWATRFNSAAPMVQDIDTKAATGKPPRYRLLLLLAYAMECLPRLAWEMDAGVIRERAKASRWSVADLWRYLSFPMHGVACVTNVTQAKTIKSRVK
jgi:hypothetical protein